MGFVIVRLRERFDFAPRETLLDVVRRNREKLGALEGLVGRMIWAFGKPARPPGPPSAPR